MNDYLTETITVNSVDYPAYIESGIRKFANELNARDYVPKLVCITTAILEPGQFVTYKSKTYEVIESDYFSHTELAHTEAVIIEVTGMTSASGAGGF